MIRGTTIAEATIMGSTGPYKMTISRNTIDKLGVKLYDKVSAVVAELVANAYDGDATEVVVELPLGQYLASRAGGTITDKGYVIRVSDTGHGMTPDEVNRFYLPIGKDRRQDPQHGATSRERNRDVLGRKGIGKLAPFGTCRTIEVLSSGGQGTNEGYVTAHLILNYGDILQETDEPYYPTAGQFDQTFRANRGTTIILRNFLYRRIPEPQVFHRQLAARFGITRQDWAIKVIDSANHATSFQIGELAVDLLQGTKIDLVERPVVLEDGTRLPVLGWVGVSRDAYRDEVMAGIRIYARGKIVAQTRDFDIPAGFTGEHTIRSYLVGVIHADWLDEDDQEDLIRSDRQDILWSSERGQAFKQWGQELVRELGRSSQSSRQQQVWTLFRGKSGIEEQAAKLFDDPDIRRSVTDVARIVARTASRDSLENPEYVQSIVDLAFHLGPHRAIVDRLHEIAIDATSPFDALVGLFTQARVAEMYSLGQIAAERVRAIENLENKLASAKEESELQKLLEEAPWLIDPQWTVLTRNQTLETFRAAFERWYESTYGTPITTSAIAYKLKRPDFILMNFGNALQVVELKKPGYQFGDSDFERMHRYYEALTTFLQQNLEFKKDFPYVFHITLVCDSVKLDGIARTAYERLQDQVLTQISWEVFLRRTKLMHEDFLMVAKSGSVR
jgi:hypothetical protein